MHPGRVNLALHKRSGSSNTTTRLVNELISQHFVAQRCKFVRTDPFYSLSSESLKQFVRRMSRIENLRSWQAENPGAWSQIKVPLIVLLLSGLVFLAVTQPNLFNSLFAFAAAGAASLPFLVNALSARLRASNASPSSS